MQKQLRRFTTILFTELLLAGAGGPANAHHTASDPTTEPILSGIDGSNNYHVTVCAGSTICFDIFVREGESARIVRWEGDLPNALFDLFNEEAAGGHLCWTAGENDARNIPYHFYVYAGSGLEQTRVEYTLHVPLILVKASVQSVSCEGKNDGQISIQPVDPASEYSYEWMDSPEERGLREGMPPGKYSVLISESTGCELAFDYQVDEPKALEMEISVTSSDCRKSTGAFSASISGGTWPYSYRWNGQEVAEPSAEKLHEGDYTIEVNDANGCTLTERIHIPAGNLTLEQLSLVPATCLSCNDGQAEISISGGKSPLEIDWFPYGGSHSLASGLVAGSYSVQVLDHHGCVAALEVSVPAANDTVLSGSNTELILLSEAR